MLESIITALKCGLLPLILLWLVYPIANVIILARVRKVWGDDESPYSQNLVDEADNTIWYGLLYLILLTIGQHCPVLVRWMIVALAAGSTLLSFVTAIGHVEAIDMVPREMRLCGVVDSVAFLLAVIVWTWLTCRMIRIFGLL